MGSITIRRLTKVYPGGVRALDALDLDVAMGEFFALLGPSGCGKTTLLRTIAGLEAATGGTIRLGDEDVTRLQPGRRDVGMVFQDYALFPHMTVMDNIAYPLRVRRQSRAVRYGRAAEAVRELGLGGWSGGARGSCRAVSSSGWRWRAPWWPIRGSSCWTSRCPTWTRGSAWRPARS
ncbi:ATP-binding cassette domain-containing protein [Actinomadura luteofluorescens]|uniref:ATP-binding cassette domain-containing protein n=1 Tax=Actinomadura luteofluorescens TaxID=46163 RepID=UPI0036339472